MTGIRYTSARAEVEIDRQLIATAADWQLDLVEMRNKYQQFCPEIFHHLRTSRVLDRCVLLLSEGPNRPLVFCYIGATTARFFGRNWASEQIGQDHMADPHAEFARAIDVEYREALVQGPVYNRLALFNLTTDPTIYTHMLLGWQDKETGRQAVLSAIDMRT